MNFNFDITLEFDTSQADSVGASLMHMAYPQIFDDSGIAVLEVEVEVEDYVPYRDAPSFRDTSDPNFFDDGDRFEASVLLFAEIDGERRALPDCLVVEYNILDDVKAIGTQRIADDILDRDLERYSRSSGAIKML